MRQSFGAQAGDAIQRFGTNAIKSWFGAGDYSINTNSLVRGGPMMQQAPMMDYSADGREVTIRWKEYVGDVFTHPTVAGRFWTQAYAINPGLVDNFPWLSCVATQYQQWKPMGILWEFKSTSGDITGSQALGKIIIATDYNTTTLQTDFVSASEMLSESYNQESVPTQNMIHGIECDPRERTRNVYFTRSGAIDPTGTLGDFDLAQTTVATVGGPTANTNLGSLWIHYDIKFYKNQLYSGILSRALVFREWNGITSITAASPYGNERNEYKYTADHGAGAPRRGIDYEDFILAAERIIFPRWAVVGSVWAFTYTCDGTGSINQQGPTFATVGLVNLLSERTPLVISNVGRVTSYHVYKVLASSVLALPEIGAITNTSLPVAPTACNVRIVSMPDYANDSTTLVDLVE